MIDYYAVVVLYNTFVDDSVTINNLRKIKSHQIHIVVLDNSTRDLNNGITVMKNGWSYLSMQGNAGLSKAYNKALDYLINEDGIVIWFDDDTNVTQEYFDILEKSVLEYKECDIFVPIIQGQDGRFWSPNEARFFKNKQMKSPTQIIPNEKINAINSCTAVRLKVYESYRYDERLFLDQVDHNFFEDQRKLKRKIKVLNVVIHHNFSTKSRMKNIETVKARYKIMIPDFLTFCSKTKYRYFLGLIKVAGWGVKEAIKYRKLSFFLWTLKEAKHYRYR